MEKKIINIKEQILNNLSGLLNVVKIKLDRSGREIVIVCEFVKLGKKSEATAKNYISRFGCGCGIYVYSNIYL